MPERKQEDIRNEYVQKCAEAGELQYKIGQMQQALASVNAKLEELNKEYVTLIQSEKKDEAVQEEAPKA